MFIKRACPNCDSDNAVHLARMSLELLLRSNPGYDAGWFAQSPIPSDHLFEFVECADCGFVFSLHRLDDSLNLDYYNEAIDEQKSLEKVFKNEKRQRLIESWSTLHELNANFGGKSTIRVLDFGAGWGDFLAVAKGYGVEVYGLEYDRRKIAFARDQGVSCGDYEFVRDHAPYDVFMCNQVLEHLDNPKQALRQLRNLLSPGAVGFIAVPNFSSNRVNDEILRLQVGELPSKDFDPLGHLNYFSPGSFHNMVMSHGFSIIDKNCKELNPQPRYAVGPLKAAIKKRFAEYVFLVSKFSSPIISKFTHENIGASVIAGRDRAHAGDTGFPSHCENHPAETSAFVRAV